MVSLTGVNATGFTAVLLDKDGNKVRDLSVSNSKITVDASALAVGEYSIKVTTVVDDNHNSVTSSAKFIVTNAGSLVTINPIADTVYGSLVDVSFDVVNVTSVSYVVKNSNGVTVVSSTPVTGNNIVLSLDAGDYTVTITNVENSNYAGDVKSADFKVLKAPSSVSVPETSVVYGNSVEVALTSVNAAGFTAVLLDNGGNKVKDLTVSNGKITIGDLAVGEYTIKVTTSVDDNHDSAIGSAKFTVTKAGSLVTIENINDVVYGNDVNVNFNVVNATIVSYVVKNSKGVTVVSNTPVTGNNIALSLDAGDYTITVANAENANYTGDVKSASFKVSKATSSVSVPETTVVYGNTAVVSLTSANATGFTAVLLDKNGNKVKDLTVSGSKITIGDLAVGEYSIKVTTNVDDNHNSATGSAKFTVTKAGSLITIENINNVVYNSPVTVNFNVLNATSVSYVVKNSKGTTVIASTPVTGNTINLNLDAADYSIEIVNAENANYTGDVKSASFKVSKAPSSVVIPETNVVYGNSVDVVVTTANATGYNAVLLDNSGNNYNVLVINNNKITVDDSALDAGEYILKVSTNTDSNHYNVTGTAKFTVEKAGSDAVVPELVVVHGESLSAKISLINASGISISSNLISVNGDTILINASVLDAGEYSFDITTVTDNNHYAVTKNVKFNVIKSETGLTASDDSIYVGENAEIKVNLAHDATGKVSLSIDNILYSADISNGAAVISIAGLKAGKYENIVVTYSGDKNYNSTTATANIYVSKIDPTVAVKVSNITFGENEIITVNINNDAEGKIFAEINNKQYESIIKNGAATFDIADLAVGNYTVALNYAGSDKYYSANNEAKFSVSKAKVQLNVGVDKTSIEIGDNVNLKLNNILPADFEGSFNVTVAGKEFGIFTVTELKNGISIAFNELGTFDVALSLINNSNYEYESFTTKINVDKVQPDVGLNINENINVGDNTNVALSLPDDATGTLSVYVDGKLVGTVPVKNGLASIPLSSLAAGSHNILIKYSGDDKYVEKTINRVIVVKEVTKGTILSAKSLEKYQGDSDKFTVTLTDSEGNPIKGAVIYITIVGKTYQTKTNDNGVAEFPINLKPGSYPVTVRFAGNANYDASSVSSEVHVLTKVRITNNNDLVKDYGDDDKYTLRIFDKYGKLAVNQYVKMTIAGKTYTIKSDKNGYASLPINLHPGKYTVVTNYDGYSVTNTVTVNEVFLVYNRQYKKASSFSYVATLKHSNGKAIVGKTLKFDFKGKIYTVKTNANGIASLIIKQPPNAGKYYMKITYNTYTITRSVTIVK